MEFTMRWFGTGYDSVSLEYIRQTPGVTGVVTTLYGTQPGDVWEKDAILAMKREVEDAGLRVAGIESVNIHDAIKIGSAERDKYIDNYITTLERLGEADIHMVCYNFMAVFDWTRSDLAKKRADGSTVMSYDHAVISAIDPNNMSETLYSQSNGFALAGWEPERLAGLKELFAMYKDTDAEKLRENFRYFLERIMPVCDKYDINMAMHPDDPAWPVFGLPRIATDREKLQSILALSDNPHHGLTLCTGSLGTSPANDIPAMIHAFKGRIHFAHVRNLRRAGSHDFEESAHLSSDGCLDMYAIMKALYDSGFDGPIRPDHGRAIWGEVAMPGYGLYDRALGASYLAGLWEAITKAAAVKAI
ncbi:MAG: mannonate dehydratase [Spirochaetales bacterium]|jgi:mannonate dehydratase|nr:mannonate dehydratase [Spirochaetales bacterium]